MDRRDDPETTGNLTDEQFSKALKVIIDSYSGAPADRLYRDAIGCFDSLIEISHNTDAIRDFARRNDIDNKYLVDGANFVISKMHFNPESNYYVTLGLPQNVSPDEIRERWKKLMLLYHPDRQEGDDSWVSERAKKVNEAYSILKDDEKRRAFDRKLTELTMTRKPESLSRTTQRATHPGSSRKISQNPEWDRKKKNIPNILVGVYLIAALVFLGYIYLRDNSEHLENALINKKESLGQAQLKSGPAIGKNRSSESKPLQLQTPDTPGEAEQKPHTLARTATGFQEQKTADLEAIPKPENIKLVPVPHMPRKAAESGALPQDKASVKENTAPIKAMPLFPAPAATTVLPPEEKNQGPAPKLPSPPVKGNPAADYSTRTREQSTPVKQEPIVFSPPAQSQKATEITLEEIEEFMKHYASTYSKSNINLFMALFSSSVIENNRLHYNEMKEAYRETFSEKINYYRINNMTIVLNGATANVSGIYDLNRYSSFEDRWTRYSGRIQWKIVKENNELKILSVHYDK